MPAKKDTRPDGPSRLSLLGIASTMGLHMVSGPLVGGGLGYLLDRHAGSAPWGALVGFLLGVCAGFRNVWADYARIRRGAEALDREEKESRSS